MLPGDDEGSCSKLGQSGYMIRSSLLNALLHLTMTLGSHLSDNGYVIDSLIRSLHVIVSF